MDDLELMELELELRRRKKGGQVTPTAPAGAAAAPASIPGAAPDMVAPAPDGQNAGTQLNPVGKIMQGAAQAVGKPIYALKQALGGLNPQEQQRIKEQEAITREAGPIAKGAEMAGDTALMFLPASKAAGAVEKASTTLQQFPRLARLLGITGAGAAGGAVSAAATPSEGETYGDQMVQKGKDVTKGAAIGALFNAGLATAGKAVTQAIKPSAEAQALMDQGIVPTVQQGAENPVARFFGGITSGVVNPAARQSREIQTAVAKKWLPGEDVGHYTVPETVQAVEARLQKLYDAALPNTPRPITAAERDTVASAVRNANFPRKARDEAMEIIQNVFPSARNVMNMKPQSISRYRDDLEAAIKKYSGSDSGHDKNVRDVLIRAKDAFDNNIRTKGLSADQLKTLQAADDMYRDTRAFVYAAEKPNVRAKGMTASALEQEMSSLNPAKAAKEGFALQQETTGPAGRVLGNMSQDKERAALNMAVKMGLGTAAVYGNPAIAIPTLGASALGQTRFGARGLMGDYDVQKRLAELVRRSKPELYSGQVGESLFGDN